jgi:hypothetical protein
MSLSPDGRRGGFLASAAAALFILGGCSGDVPSVSPPAGGPSTAPIRPEPEPETPKRSTASESAKAAPKAAPPAQPPVLTASEPAAFSIPAIGAGSELLSLGLRDNGSLEVPPDGPGAPASWYNQSPTPGERGPAVLLGHVNATGGGPGVFADLRRLVAGDRITVDRENGTTAVFKVTRARQYAKDAFPTREVYGNTPGSELRLVTCDGYNPATGEFDDNYVVYAQLAK